MLYVCARVCVYVCVRVCVCDSDLQVQVHPARHANTFGFGESVLVGCQARGCAAPGRNLALYRCVAFKFPVKKKKNAKHSADLLHTGTD